MKPEIKDIRENLTDFMINIKGRTTSEIQNIINTNIFGATIFFPETETNIYEISDTLKLPSDTRLFISEKVTLKLKNGTNKPLIQNADIINGNEKITIFGGQFDGNRTNQTSPNAVIDLFKITASYFKDVKVTGAKQVNPGKAAFHFEQSEYNTVENCEVYNTDFDGLFFYKSNRNKVLGGHYHDCGGSPVGLVVGEENEFIDIKAHDGGFTNLTINGKKSKVIHCTSYNSLINGITIGHSTQYNGDYLYADDTICECNISFNNANNGITIDGSLDVICNNNNVFGNGGTSGNYAGIFVAYNATAIIEGNQVKANLQGIRLQGDVSPNNIKDCIVKGNKVRNNKLHGVVVDKGKYNLIECNTIKNNGQQTPSNGLYLYSSECQYNSIIGNLIYDDQPTPTQTNPLLDEGSINIKRGNRLTVTQPTFTSVNLTSGTSTVVSNSNIRADIPVDYHPSSASAAARGIYVQSIGNGTITFGHNAGGESDYIRINIG